MDTKNTVHDAGFVLCILGAIGSIAALILNQDYVLVAFVSAALIGLLMMASTFQLKREN